MRRLFDFLYPRSKEEKRVIQFIRDNFGVSPSRVVLYTQALRHKSAVMKGAVDVERSNERLEFLGDAILDAIVAEYLYIEHHELGEGELTKMKSKVVSRKMLNQLGKELGVEELLNVKMGSQPVQLTLVGNALEALIGAIYVDQGYRVCKKVVIKLLKDLKIDDRIHEVTDFKSKLHEYCQKRKKSLRFDVLREKRTVSGTYEIGVYVNDRQLGLGVGKSKKHAEQLAAKEACQRIFGE